jgi:hypothetical protein
VKRTHWLVGAVLAMGAVGATGCSSSTTAGTSTSTSAAASTSRPPVTSAGSTSTTTPTSSSTTTPSPTSTTVAATTGQNLPVTEQIRAQLVAAGAAANGIPVAEYTGLAPGLTFYALDRATATYWAGARLVPAPTADPSNPSRAQVASQDAGSYTIFTQPQGGNWTAHAAGASGPQSPCQVTVPPSVVSAWGWPSGSCRPPNA